MPFPSEWRPAEALAPSPADGPAFAGLAMALLQEGLSVRFVVDGVSMRPTLEPQDTVLVAPVAEIARGDIALYAAEGTLGYRLFLHRVHALEGTGCLLLGDAYPARPEHLHRIPRAALLGQVIEASRDGRILPLHGPWTWMKRALRRWLRRTGQAA